MSIGKWIGGVLGFMAFGPLGALAGILLGSFFEEGANMTGQPFGGGTNYDDEYTRRDLYAGERNSFLFSMLVMASYIIRADGKIMHSEMEYVRQFLRRNFGEIAVSQGEEILLKLFDQAKRMDQEVAIVMGMSEREVESMLNLKGSSLDDAYKVLEIEPTATDEEVRAAYRRMAVKHHPDKVASLGEDIRKAANEKFQKINEAKERIYQSRGLK